MPAKGPHPRKCHDCGNVATHEDSVVPEVLCKKCGSQDTRILKQPNISPAPPLKPAASAANKVTLKIQSLEINYSGDSEEIKKILANIGSLLS